MRESSYQAYVINKLREEFPNCVVLKNDASYLQGVPDLLVLYKNKWAMLEVKQSYLSPHQPNQDYWIDVLDSMSMAAYLFPECETEVFDELRRLFKVRQSARVLTH